MEKDTINLDLFSPKKAELQEAASKYKDLKIEWIDDKKWYEVVHKAQMELRSMRTAIQKTRLDYTRQFDQAKKDAISLEKELLDIITPIEEMLKSQKDEVDVEKERIKQEELEKKRKFLQDRVDQLSSVQYSHHDLHELSQMSEEDFQALLSEKKTTFEAQQKKLEEERLLAQKNEIRSKILNAQNLETISEIEDYIENIWFDLEEFKQDIDAKRWMLEQQAKLDAQQKKIDEENARIEKEKQEKARQEELEKAQKEAAEKARKEEQERIKKEQEEKERKAKEEAEKKAQEEKEAQEKLEKETKYKNFLKKNEWNFDKIVKEEWKVVLYKKVDEFIL